MTDKFNFYSLMIYFTMITRAIVITHKIIFNINKCNYLYAWTGELNVFDFFSRSMASFIRAPP